jgi:hypothetical protein
MRTILTSLVAGASLVAALNLSPAVLATALTMQEQCSVAAPASLHLIDGPFSHVVVVKSGGYGIWLAPYPRKVPALPPSASGAAVDQFAVSRSGGLPTYEGLVYVYAHNAGLHVCGSGVAVANRQSAPTYAPFRLDVQLTRASLVGDILFGTAHYALAGETQGLTSIVPESATLQDQCALTVPTSLQPLVGPFTSGVQGTIAGYKLWISRYPAQPSMLPSGGGVEAAVYQFAFTRPERVLDFEGLAYAYIHGAQLHICGSGRAVADRQSAPTYMSFHLNGIFTPMAMTAALQLGAVHYLVTGPASAWTPRP